MARLNYLVCDSCSRKDLQAYSDVSQVKVAVTPGDTLDADLCVNCREMLFSMIRERMGKDS